MTARVLAATLLGIAAFALAGASEGGIPAGEPRPSPSGIKLPVLVTKVEPDYPLSLASRGEQGNVALQALVHADGTVSDITVLSSEHEELTRSAISAVEQWRYAPALLDGKPIDLYYTIVVRFSAGGVPEDVPSPRECYGEHAEGPAESVERPPRPEWKEPVVLPERLETAGGEVEIEFEVCRDGRVRSVEVLRASDSALGRAARNAARRWTFSPALRAGQPVAARHRAVLTITPSRH